MPDEAHQEIEAECREQADLLTRAADHLKGMRLRVECAENGHEAQRRNTLAFMREKESLEETLATIRRILATVPYPLGPYGALGEISQALGRKSV